MRRWGFTGTKLGMRLIQMAKVEEILRKNYWPGNEFHHGDCIGSDLQAAGLADIIGYKIWCHPPINSKNRARYPRWDFIYPEDEYVARDQKIVDDTEALIATPHTLYEITRSGTWTTVRYARKLKRPIWIVLPNGEVDHN